MLPTFIIRCNIIKEVLLHKIKYEKLVERFTRKAETSSRRTLQELCRKSSDNWFGGLVVSRKALVPGAGTTVDGMIVVYDLYYS